jgi:hypothetical protein
MINKICCFSCKVCYSCDILIKIEFSYQYSKNIQSSNFMIIREVGAELFHAGGRT